MSASNTLSALKKLHWLDFIWINFFWLGLNVRNTAVGSIFTPYLVEHYAPAAWKNTALSAMGTAGLVIAMLIQPIAGALSDRSTSRYGRRRPFILVGALLDLVFLAAIGLSWNYWSLLVATLLIQFSANLSHGPLQAVIPDIVPEDQRGRASAVKALFELMPIFLVGVTIASMVGAGQFSLAIAVTGAVVLLSALVTMLTVKEQPIQEKPAGSFWPPILRAFYMLGGILAGALLGLLGGGVLGGLAGLIAWVFSDKTTAIAVMVGLGGVLAMILSVVLGVWAGSITAIGKEVRQHTSFVWWIVNRLFFLAAITSLQRFALYFLMYSFKIDVNQATTLFGRLISLVGIFTLGSALAAGWLADRFSHKLLVGWSGVLAAAGGILLIGTIWVPSEMLIYIAGTVLGLATGMFMTTNWAMGTGLVPSEEAGRYLGISNLAGAGAGMIGGSIGGPIADYLNIGSPGMGYFVIFAGYAVLFLLSTVSLRFIRQRGQAKEAMMVAASTP